MSENTKVSSINFDNFKITKIEGPSYMGIGNVHDENENIYTQSISFEHSYLSVMYRLHEEQCQDTFRIRSQVEDYEEFLKN